MTYTDKILAEFDSLYEEHKEILDIPVCCTNEDCLCNKDTVWEHLKSFLSTSIHQALAEERKRVVKSLVFRDVEYTSLDRMSQVSRDNYFYNLSLNQVKDDLLSKQ